MVLQEQFRRRLIKLLLVAFILAASFTGVYFYIIFTTRVNAIRTTIDILRGSVESGLVNSLSENLSGITAVFISQLVAFVVAVVSLVYGFWYVSGLYLLERRNAFIDPLTQIYNRKAIMFALDKELRRSIRFKHPLAVAIVDIDYFKVYNDTLGHPAGDKLLKKFSRILMNSVRKVDYFGRIGGEEFLIILPETNLKDGAKLVDRIRETVADTDFYGESKLPHKKVTISVGIAEFIVGGKIKRKDLIDRADERLYKAKHAGRNVVVSK